MAMNSHRSHSGIVNDQQLKGMKLDYLKKQGFKLEAGSWVYGSRKVRASLINDSEIPLRVFINLVQPIIQAAAEAKAKSKARNKVRNKTKKRATNRTFDELEKTDALDHRLPGSYGTGKRR
jgi:hypothetical protein